MNLCKLYTGIVNSQINAKNGIGSRSHDLNVSFVNTFSYLCLNFYQLYQISRP